MREKVRGILKTKITAAVTWNNVNTEIEVEMAGIDEATDEIMALVNYKKEAEVWEYRDKEGNQSISFDKGKTWELVTGEPI